MDEKPVDGESSASGTSPAPLSDEEIEARLPRIPKWNLVEEDGVNKLRRTLTFKDFARALDFTNRLGRIAEDEGHHPIITLTWGRATVTWYSHSIGGLHEDDFAMAARTDQLYSDL